MKDIRGSMGSDDLAYKIFDKVFKTDINRLLGMEDMWKTRKAPHVLEFMGLSAKAQVIESSVAQQDLVIWSEVENFKVFCDSLERLSARCQKASNSKALVFDKDDEDILDFIASSANLRSIVFGLEIRSKFDIKQMAGNIIPAIATTNAMTAALCVLQAFKVMREELGRARMIFLERSVARVINSDTLKPPNPECTVCGVIQSRLIIDSTRATLNDLVEDVLRKQLGYGEEFTVNNEVGTLYDPELDDNLSKKLSELNVKADSFLLVIDDDDDSPRVNLSLSISERYYSLIST